MELDDCKRGLSQSALIDQVSSQDDPDSSANIYLVAAKLAGAELLYSLLVFATTGIVSHFVFPFPTLQVTILHDIILCWSALTFAAINYALFVSLPQGLLSLRFGSVAAAVGIPLTLVGFRVLHYTPANPDTPSISIAMALMCGVWSGGMTAGSELQPATPGQSVTSKSAVPLLWYILLLPIALVFALKQSRLDAHLETHWPDYGIWIAGLFAIWICAAYCTACGVLQAWPTKRPWKLLGAYVTAYLAAGAFIGKSFGALSPNALADFKDPIRGLCDGAILGTMLALLQVLVPNLWQRWPRILTKGSHVVFRRWVLPVGMALAALAMALAALVGPVKSHGSDWGTICCWFLGYCGGFVIRFHGVKRYGGGMPGDRMKD